jgi:hypothetical protein
VKLAITLEKEIKVAKWGTPKNIFKNTGQHENSGES